MIWDWVKRKFMSHTHSMILDCADALQQNSNRRPIRRNWRQGHLPVFGGGSKLVSRYSDLVFGARADE